MIAFGAFAPYIVSMHAHLSALSTGWIRRAVRLTTVFFSTLFAAAPALAQDLPTGSRSGSLLNILLLALIAFFLVRAFRRRGGNDDTRPGRWTPTEREDDDDEAGARPKPMDRHEAARRAWDILGSKDAEQPSATTPTGQPAEERADGFDEVEFLEGAKLFFTRFQQAREEGDFSGIREFLSDDVVAEFEDDGGRVRIEVMLLTARLVELKSEDGRTTATVFYDARLRTGEQGDRTEHVRQVWELSRDDGRPDALWILERIDNVDQ